MSYPQFGNVSLGNTSGNIKLYINNSGTGNISGIGYNSNCLTFGVNQSVTAIPDVVINQFGNIGIGTTNPVTTLDVNGNISLGNLSGNIKLYINNSGVGNISGIGYNSNCLTFGVNQSVTDIPDVVINQFGNIGIGTTNPVTTLDVNGNISLGNLSGNIKLYINNSGTGNISGIGYNSNCLTFGVNQSVTAIPEVVINQFGNVGIGTTNPLSTLHVVNTTTQAAFTNGASNFDEGTVLSANGTITEIKMNNAGGAHFTISNDGNFKINNTSASGNPFTAGTNVITIPNATNNVGIGTATPGYPLDVKGPSGTLLRLINNNTAYTGGQSNIEFWNSGTLYNLAMISAVDIAIASNAYNGVLALSGSWNTGLVEGMRIVPVSSTQARVGILNTNPAYTLDVAGAARICCAGLGTSGSSITFSGVNGNYTTIDSTGSSVGLGFLLNGSEKMRITSGGSVGIGTITPAYPLDVNGTARISGITHISSSSTLAKLCATSAGEAFEFASTTGTTNQCYLDIHSQTNESWDFDWRWMYSGVTSVYLTSRAAGGVQLNGGATAWVAYSDLRLKKDIEPIPTALENILNLNPVHFNYKTDTVDAKRRVGFIAQEVLPYFPLVIEETEKLSADKKSISLGNFYTLSLTELVPYMIKAMQEQQTMIQSLEARLAALENK